VHSILRCILLGSAASTALLAGATVGVGHAGPVPRRARPAAGQSAKPERTGGTIAERLATFRRPSTIPAPRDNRITPARTALGRALFFDPRLSRSGSMSCATCHNPALSWSDALPTAVGDHMTPLGRRTPTVLNLAWAAALFWDGRAESLEEQALGPIQATEEMNLPLDQLTTRLRAIPGYAPAFAAAYPGEAIAPPTVARALATYQRTLVSASAPFDRWVAGEPRALTPEAKAGFDLFTGKAGCANCHSGWRFTDDSFHDIGVGGADSGRAHVLPDVPAIEFAFKTPTLRNVAVRAPYMHDGSERTLDDVIDLYDRGGRVRRASLSDEVRPLHLSAAERRALLSFLESLTSRDAAVVMPTLPR
jgi:cytochrome c peroxidase